MYISCGTPAAFSAASNAGHLVDALVGLGVLDQQRRLDLRHAGSLGRRAIERHAGVQVAAHGDREEVDRATAPAEAGHAEVAVRELVRLENGRAVEHVGPQLGLVEGALQGAAVVVVAGVTANREEAVGARTTKPSTAARRATSSM
jgi:hypothetical protein